MIAEAYNSNLEYYAKLCQFFSNLELYDSQTSYSNHVWNVFYNINYYSSNLTQSFLNIFFLQDLQQKFERWWYKKYYKEDHFSFLVVEAKDLYYGFDLSKAEEYEIAVKIVTQSYSVIGNDGKNVDAIVGGWKITRILSTWIKDSSS